MVFTSDVSLQQNDAAPHSTVTATHPVGSRGSRPACSGDDDFRNNFISPICNSDLEPSISNIGLGNAADNKSPHHDNNHCLTDVTPHHVKQCLDNHTFWVKYFIKPSIGDGHCFIYSLRDSYNSQLKYMPNTNSSLLLKKLESETLKNARLYSTVIPNKSQAVLLEQMKQYIDYKNYKTLFGDMVPLIMCNALNINLIVISKRSTGYDVMTVNTGDKPGDETILSPHVVLMKCDEHYDACMQCLDIDINNHTNFCEPRMLPAYQYLESHPVNAVSALVEKSCTTNSNSPCASVNTLVANGCTTLSSSSFEFQHDVFKSLLTQCGGFLRFLDLFSYISPSNYDAIVDEKNIGYQGQLFQFRAKYPKNLLCGHLNINRFRNKFTEIEYILTQNLMDVLFVSETKIDSSFTNAQFHINDFKLHRSDRNCHGGGILAYVRSDLPHRRRYDLEDLVCNPIESLVLEMCIRKEKWLFICMYSPNNKYKYICNEVLDSLLDTARSSGISNIHVLCIFEY